MNMAKSGPKMYFLISMKRYKSPRFRSGIKIISRFSIEFTTFIAFADVQHISDSAFTAAELFT